MTLFYEQNEKKECVISDYISGVTGAVFYAMDGAIVKSYILVKV